MEPEDSSPFTQQSSTCLHPEPNEYSTPQRMALMPVVILLSPLRLGLQKELFPSFMQAFLPVKAKQSRYRSGQTLWMWGLD
jgi:hypothetical protein